MIPPTGIRLARKAGQAETLSSALRGARVSIHQEYFYRVDFGPDVDPRVHIVGKDGACTCGLEKDCPAVQAVKRYLKAGGESAGAPRPGYYPAAPRCCPICRSEHGLTVPARYDPGLSSKHRGIGWRCSKYGAAHYWLDQARAAAQTSVRKGLPVDPPAAHPFPDGYDPERVYPEPPLKSKP